MTANLQTLDRATEAFRSALRSGHGNVSAFALQLSDVLRNDLESSINDTEIDTLGWDSAAWLERKQGWICPICSRVWSPEVEECWHCNDKLSNDKDHPEEN